MSYYETEELVDRGDDFYERGEYDRAVDFYIRALEMDIRNPEALEGLGQAYEALGDWEGAIRAFRELADADPECPFVHYLLGHALGAVGEHDQALAALRKAEAMGYHVAEIYSAIGYSTHMKGDLDGALESYHQALDLDPDDTITLFNLGKALVAQGDYRSARRVLTEAADIDPEDSQTWIALGEVCEYLDDWDLVLDACGRALELDPCSVEARSMAARAYLMLGRLKDAEKQYLQVVEDNPDDGDGWAGLAEVLIAQENYRGAVAACRRALDTEPTSIYALSAYASACEHIGTFDEARRLVTDATKVDPQSADLWYLLGGIEAAAQRPERALPAYERAVQLNPSDAAAHVGIARALLVLQQDLARAEQHLRESVRLAPDWYYPYLQLGELFLQQNDPSAATEWFIRAGRAAPDEPEVRLALADPRIQPILDGGRTST